MNNVGRFAVLWPVKLRQTVLPSHVVMPPCDFLSNVFQLRRNFAEIQSGGHLRRGEGLAKCGRCAKTARSTVKVRHEKKCGPWLHRLPAPMPGCHL